MDYIFAQYIPYNGGHYFVHARVWGIQLAEAVAKVIAETYNAEEIVVLREDWQDLKKIYVQDHDFDDLFTGQYDDKYEVL